MARASWAIEGRMTYAARHQVQFFPADMEREVGAARAELSSMRRQLQQHKGAREAAEERAAAAMAHMHSSELRYQQQVEGLQRQLLAATRQRWREDLGLDGGADGGDDPHASRPAKRQHQQQHTPAAGGAAAAAGARAPQPPPAQPGGEDEGEEEERRREAEELLLRARAPDEVQLEEQPKRQEQAGAWVSVGVGDGGGGEAVDPYGRDPAFAVQHVERLVVEDTALGVLPEVARLLELQRRLMGRGVGEQQ